MRATTRWSVGVLAWCLVAFPALAGGLTVSVVTPTGEAVEDAVVELIPSGGRPPASQMTPQIITQRNRSFIPSVTVIRVGNIITFPNLDEVQHHVYSFSDAKRFDIPLYRDKPPAPVVFDKPGVVVLGCNIHDSMKAYVYVAQTPYFAKSGPDGRIRISDLPAGSYGLHFWYPHVKRMAGTPLPVIVAIGAGSTSLTATVEIKKESGFGRGPAMEVSGYR